ncbi:hypothetical protein ROZALSC1DRAFT_23321 [Rozella allomycis CSF55]|uniref:Uncharacterized protein n=1 Tax=Rozella allomycis (strain CSF55) TaxID=988480 RepID=A0A4P9YFW2_ROZAC|nr:hypothetical protein ROZALSC1DRAFT_23321 [Rozella allomycis CSF55]
MIIFIDIPTKGQLFYSILHIRTISRNKNVRTFEFIRDNHVTFRNEPVSMNDFPDYIKSTISDIFHENTILEDISTEINLRKVFSQESDWATLKAFQVKALEYAVSYVPLAFEWVTHMTSEYYCDTAIYSIFLDHLFVALCGDERKEMFLSRNDEFDTRMDVNFNDEKKIFKPKPDGLMGISSELVMLLFEAKKVNSTQDENLFVIIEAITLLKRLFNGDYLTSPPIFSIYADGQLFKFYITYYNENGFSHDLFKVYNIRESAMDCWLLCRNIMHHISKLTPEAIQKLKAAVKVNENASIGVTSFLSPTQAGLKKNKTK